MLYKSTCLTFLLTVNISKKGSDNLFAKHYDCDYLQQKNSVLEND